MAKIVFLDVTSTVSYGGIQTAIWQLAIALHDAGHEVSVVGGQGYIRPDLGGRSIGIHTFPYTHRDSIINFGNRFRKLVERLTLARTARKHLIDTGYDWVILSKPFDFFWPWILPKDLPTRFAFMSGGTDFFAGDRWLGKKVDAWLACSHFNAWQIHHRYSQFPRVIYNGVDVTVFAPRTTDSGNRQRWGIGSDEILFAFAGRLVGWKGIDVAIQSLVHPALSGVPVKLLLIGSGPQERKLRLLAEELAVADQVVFAGPVPHHELPAIYADVDAGIFPSIGDEAFGITIAEAMSCGKPVIASHIGGIPEVVGNEGSAGILVTPGDSSELAIAMKQLACDAALRQAMGKTGRKRVEQQFTWTLSASRLAKELGLA